MRGSPAARQLWITGPWGLANFGPTAQPPTATIAPSSEATHVLAGAFTVSSPWLTGSWGPAPGTQPAGDLLRHRLTGRPRRCGGRPPADLHGTLKGSRAPRDGLRP